MSEQIYDIKCVTVSTLTCVKDFWAQLLNFSDNCPSSLRSVRFGLHRNQNNYSPSERDLSMSVHQRPLSLVSQIISLLLQISLYSWSVIRMRMVNYTAVDLFGNFPWIMIMSCCVCVWPGCAVSSWSMVGLQRWSPGHVHCAGEVCSLSQIFLVPFVILSSVVCCGES